MSDTPNRTGEPAASSLTAIGLIANREIATRLRSKAWLISTILAVVILVAVAVLGKLIGGGSTTYDVGLTPSTAAYAAPLTATAGSVGTTVRTVTVADRGTGTDRVRSGDLDALLVDDNGTLTVIVKKNLSDTLNNVLTVTAGQVAVAQQITRLGGDPATVARAAANAKVTVSPLEPPKKYDTQRLVLGIIAGILIYLALMLAGQAVAQGVVEEKSSRVVELLLATVRPWQLMSGKVAGIGLVSLLQVAIIGVAGVASGRFTGTLHVRTSDAVGVVVWLVVWFLLGYLAYALAFAAVGALVSRQEDVASVVTPVLMFVVVGYVLGISILPGDPGNQLLAILSMIPVFAPTLMPMRIALGGVPVWQLVVSVGAMVVLIPLLVGLSARIYRNAVLRSGARIKLRDAWRAA